MEIILKEDVVNLGYKNDIVTVKSGYGRNYLIPLFLKRQYFFFLTSTEGGVKYLISD